MLIKPNVGLCRFHSLLYHAALLPMHHISFSSRKSPCSTLKAQALLGMWAALCAAFSCASYVKLSTCFGWTSSCSFLVFRTLLTCIFRLTCSRKSTRKHDCALLPIIHQHAVCKSIDWALHTDPLYLPDVHFGPSMPAVDLAKLSQLNNPAADRH